VTLEKYWTSLSNVTSENLIIHCEFGVSRSAAVAEIAEKILKVKVTHNRKPSPNNRVMRLLEEGCIVDSLD